MTMRPSPDTRSITTSRAVTLATVEFARKTALATGFGDKATFVQRDMYEAGTWRLADRELRLTIGGVDYIGTVAGERVQGTRGPTRQPWSATRTGK